MKRVLLAASALVVASVSAAHAEDLFAVAYGNTVTDTMPDGSRNVLYINPDHTWEQHGADGKTVKGTYAWKDDHTACFTVTYPAPQDPSTATTCTAQRKHKVGETWTEPSPDNKGVITTALTAGRQAPPSPASACQDPVHRQLDFLLGTWDVKINPGRWWNELSPEARKDLAHGDRRTLNGQKFATAKFERVVDGCAILHSWTPVTPGQNTGKALLTYGSSEKKWHYFWAGNGGGPVHYTGSVEKPDSVQYYLVTSGKDGGDRFSYEALPDGRIREIGEAPVEGGKNWTTEYDLIWTKQR